MSTAHRRVSLTWSLLLGTGGILLLVVVSLAVVAHREVRQSAMTSAAEQLARASHEVAGALQSLAGPWLESAAAAAADPALGAFLEYPGTVTRQAADMVLRSAAAGDELIVAAALIDRDVVRAASAGEEEARELLSGVGLPAAEGIGRLGAVGETAIFPVAVPVPDGRGARLVIWRRLDLDLRLAGARVFVGNADGGPWTDLEAVVALPPEATRGDAGMARYSRGGVVRLAGSAPVPSAPWLVLTETAENDVLAPSRRFLARIALLSALLFAVGLLAALLLGRRIVRPLRSLTTTAGAMSASDYSVRSGVEGSDEIGRLGAAFDAMAERVEVGIDRLERQSAQYRMLFERNPNPMWVYERGSLRLLAVNEAAVERYGYTREELLGMTIDQIRPAEEVPRLLEDVAAGHEGLDFAGVWRHRTKSGEEILVEITSNEVELDGKNAVLVLAHDVTRRHRMEEALRAAHERLRAIVESAPVAILSLGEEGTVTSWNRAAEEIFGWNGPEVTGGPLPAGLEPLTREGESERNGPEATCRRKDGSSVPVRFRTGELYDASGGVTGTIVIAVDATEVHRLEEQYRQAQKMEAVGRLAGGVAHDFNNLLTVILGEADLALEETTESDPLAAAFERIEAAARRAAALTGQLLAFSRQHAVEVAVVDVNELVGGLEAMLHRLLPEDIDLSIRAAPDAGAARVDRNRIEQLLVNLLVNARDAMPDGGLLVVETSRIELDEEYVSQHFGGSPGEYVRISVSDSGEGMSEEVLRQAFEPFFTTKPTGKGTGLGLATSYGIAKQAGGSIELYSEVGVGTVVKVYLPRTTRVAGSAASSRRRRSSRGGERILVVEDEPAVCEVTARMLSSMGYAVTTAMDAEEALRVLEGEGPVDLLLTDVVLPGTKGGELARRAGELRPGLKVLFASGYTQDIPAYQQLIEASAALVEKPFTVATLGRKVREVLDGGDRRVVTLES